MKLGQKLRDIEGKLEKKPVKRENSNNKKVYFENSALKSHKMATFIRNPRTRNKQLILN